MDQNAGAGDIRAFHCIRIGVLACLKHLHKLMDEVRVGAAMACTLGEGKVFLTGITTIDTTAGEELDLLWQILGEIRGLYFGRNFRLRQLGGVNHQWAVLDERPFHGFLIPVNFDGFTVLPCHIE